MDKHYSLLRKSVNSCFEKFYDTGPWSDVSVTANNTGACATKVFTAVNVAYSRKPDICHLNGQWAAELNLKKSVDCTNFWESM